MERKVNNDTEISENIMEAYVVSSVAGILTERKELRANKQQSDSEKNNQFSLNN